MNIKKQIKVLIPENFCCEGMKHSITNEHFRFDKNRGLYFKTRCGTADESTHIMVFCPYCGEEIKIKENVSKIYNK